ncbi:alpha/beta hydrolase family esterase [Nocardia sp. NBC_00511]|uniref:alpha/beta hydrolase family esterase n=1 Tax=Nocardia sp. NBC_00511 TaxID=2903591 RepID=UPI0030DF6466
MSDQLIEAKLMVDGRERTFAVRPPNRQDAPLVLALHGNHGQPVNRMMVDMTSFAAHADSWGIAVAYPDGWGGCWADGRGATTADDAGVDDVAFLRAVIEWCEQQYGTDPERTVVAGISNGAFMSHRLALEAADRVAVIGAVAGGMARALAEVRPTHAVSALLIHGDGDITAPITGGHSRHRGPNGEIRGHVMGLDDTARRWREVDDCAGELETVTTAETSRVTARDGVGGTAVTAWTVSGGGHTWPGTPMPEEWASRPGTGVTMEFDAAEEIWRFAEPLLCPAADRKL